MATVIIDGDQVTTVTSQGAVTGTLDGASAGPLQKPTLDRVIVSFEKLATEQTWPGIALNWFVRQTLRAPLRAVQIVEADNETRETRLLPTYDRVAECVKEPWPGASQGDLATHLVGSLKVEGNSLAEFDSGAREKIRINPRKWNAVKHHVGDNDWMIDGWTIGNRPVTAAEMVHIAMWAPGGAIGISPLQQVGWTVRSEQAAQESGLASLLNGTSLSGTVKISDNLLGRGKKQRQEIIDKVTQNFRAALSGPANQRKLAVIPPGAEFSEATGVSAVDAELIKQRELNREEIAAVYGLPPVVLGILDEANYSNLESLIPYAVMAGLAPDLILIEQRLSTKLRRLTGRDDIAVEFDMTQLLRGNFLKEIEAGRAATGVSTYTPQEFRDRMGLRRLTAPGIDDLWVDSRSNVAPMSSPSPTGDTSS